MNKAEKLWDSSAANYDKTEERFEHIHSRSRENARKHLKDGDVVLDYGCGTGTTSCDVVHLVKEIHAIDISSKMIEIAREKADAGNIQNAHFEQADVFDERFKAASFDVILVFNMLHTVPDPQAVVRRIHELLKPGGLVVSVTPCLRDRMSLLVRMKIQLVQILCLLGIIPVPIRRITNSEIDALTERGDFQTIDTERIYKGASSYFLVANKIRRESSKR
jgi:ubiquinone/menaquinone biosynthesis C-methylase UbiE